MQTLLCAHHRQPVDFRGLMDWHRWRTRIACRRRRHTNALSCICMDTFCVQGSQGRPDRPGHVLKRQPPPLSTVEIIRLAAIRLFVLSGFFWLHRVTSCASASAVCVSSLEELFLRAASALAPPYGEAGPSGLPARSKSSRIFRDTAFPITVPVSIASLRLQEPVQGRGAWWLTRPSIVARLVAACAQPACLMPAMPLRRLSQLPGGRVHCPWLSAALWLFFCGCGYLVQRRWSKHGS